MEKRRGGGRNPHPLRGKEKPLHLANPPNILWFNILQLFFEPDYFRRVISVRVFEILFRDPQILMTPPERMFVIEDLFPRLFIDFPYDKLWCDYGRSVFGRT